jgi:16S rRNA (uracil1498-N3)-methyltransferase
MSALPRLFVAPERLCPPTPLLLHGPEHHYLSRVLRLAVGAKLLLLDGHGRLLTARIERASSDELELTYLAVAEPAGPPGPQVTLYLGLLKGEKHDLVIQKATELGVARIVNVHCRRSVPVLGGERADKRLLRWQRVVQAAAAQCRRPDLPQVAGPLPLLTALAAATARHRLLLYEGPAPGLRALLAAAAGGGELAGEVALVVGPEGGFDPSEVAAATAADFIPASLGPRILRAETAALAALAVVLTG